MIHAASILRLGLCAWLVAAVGCVGGRIQVEEAGPLTPWTHLEVRDAPGDFKFVVVADRTGGARHGVFESAIGKINALRPAFVLSVGDLIQGYSEDPVQLEAQWREFDGFVEGLNAPFFYVAGNHDYSNPTMARDWLARFGRSYYHFRYRDVLFLVLNSEIISSVSKPGQPVKGGDRADEQLRYVERVLGEHADARWTVVVVHQPLWDGERVHEDWLRVEELLGERDYSVFAGHFHRYTKALRRDRRYITLATTGGVSRLRGIDRGEFDHVALVSMSDEGPVVANLMLDGIHDEDVRTEATRTLLRQLDGAVRMEPLRIDGESLRNDKQRVRFHNESLHPIVVRARVDASTDFIPGSSEFEQALAPGERITREISLRPTRFEPLTRVTPALIHFSVETEQGALGARAPIRVESQGWLVPERDFPVPPVRGVMHIDGDLAEWGALRFEMKDWPVPGGGTARASLRFDVRADVDQLLVAVDVSDPSPVVSSERSAREQDAVTIEIDARPDPARSANQDFYSARASGTIAQSIFASLTAAEAAADPVMAALLPALPKGSKRASRQRDGGYSVELAIPRSFLDERAGEPCRRFRLNLVLHDFDTEGGEARTHPWRPVRYGITGLPLEGAGTFYFE